MPEQVVQGALENLRLRLDVPSLVGRKPRSLRAEHISSSYTAMRRSLPQISNRKWYRANPRPSSRSRGRTGIGRFANHPYTFPLGPDLWSHDGVAVFLEDAEGARTHCDEVIAGVADFGFDGGD